MIPQYNSKRGYSYKVESESILDKVLSDYDAGKSRTQMTLAIQKKIYEILQALDKEKDTEK